jgi:hypothetical protein
MPKIPRGEWERQFDPDSPEYAPTDAEIAEDREAARELNGRLRDIAYEIANPGEDYLTGRKDNFISDPDDIWTSLLYIEHDDLPEIRDPQLREEIEARIKKISRNVYQLYVPFLDRMVQGFGRQQSPLEKFKSRYETHPDDIAIRFLVARKEIELLGLTDEERIDFETELDRLTEKVDRYQRESTLYTFERMEMELQQTIDREQLSVLWATHDSKRALGGEVSNDEYDVDWKALLETAKRLVEIARGMTDEEIRSRSTVRAQGLLESIEYLNDRIDAPYDLSKLEGELKDLMFRELGGERVSDEELNEFRGRIDLFEQKRLGAFHHRIVKGLSNLFKRIERVHLGEEIDEDEDRFKEAIGSPSWAWVILGLVRGASASEVKKAYRRLILKYHPDRNTDSMAEERMKRINEAYEFIDRVSSREKRED